MVISIEMAMSGDKIGSRSYIMFNFNRLTLIENGRKNNMCMFQGFNIGPK